MARAYTVGTVALALDVPTKWIDNILSHHRVAGVVQERQGVSRKVALDGVLELVIGLRLIRDFQIPASHALRLARDISTNEGNHHSPSGLTISVELSELRRELESNLAQAVEVAPVPKRGRPSR